MTPSETRQNTRRHESNHNKKNRKKQQISPQSLFPSSAVCRKRSRRQTALERLTEKICSKMRMVEERKQPPHNGKMLKNPTTFRFFLFFSFYLHAACGTKKPRSDLIKPLPIHLILHHVWLYVQSPAHFLPSLVARKLLHTPNLQGFLV